MIYLIFRMVLGETQVIIYIPHERTYSTPSLGDGDPILLSQKTELHPLTHRDDMAFCGADLSDHIYVCSSF